MERLQEEQRERRLVLRLESGPPRLPVDTLTPNSADHQLCYCGEVHYGLQTQFDLPTRVLTVGHSARLTSQSKEAVVVLQLTSSRRL